MPDGLLSLSLAIGATVHLLALLLLYLAAAPAIHAGRQTWIERRALLGPHNLPPLALIIPLSGDSPAIRKSLATLLHQPGVDFSAWLVVRDAEDTAVAAVQELAERFPHAQLVVAGAATRCCQKNHSLLAGIKAAGDAPEILIFCDSSHEAAPDFLARLAAPVARGEAALSTTYHRILPQNPCLPSLCHFFSAQFIHLLQNLPCFRLPWGGATAIRRTVFFRQGIDAIWARGVVDDFTMGPYLQARGIRAAAVPEASLLTRLGPQTWSGWCSWWFRQLLYLKFCMPGTWLAATLAPLGGGVLLGLAVWDMLRGGWLGFAYLAALGCVGALYGGLCQLRLPMWRRALGFFAMQVLTVPCFLATWATNTLRWRGIAYRARLDGTVAAIINRDDYSVGQSTADLRPAGPLRLAVLLQDLEFGGTQRYALQILRGLDRSLFTPELWVLNSGSDLEAEARTTGVPLVRISNRPPGSPLGPLLLAVQFARSRPDILYTLTVVPNIWGRLLGRVFSVPAIVTGFRELRPKQWEPLLWRFTDRLICNAEILRTRAVNELGVPPERVTVVPNCVDTKRFRPAAAPDCNCTDEQNHPPSIVSVARLVRDKSPLAMVEAFALVCQEVPEARLTIVGDGPLRPQAEARLAELGLTHAVQIITGCGEVRPHLAQADVFALASRREGSPNVVLEAMASGLPVVASRTGGIPDLVEHGRTGLLTVPEDPDDIARALILLLTDRELRTSMGAAGRDKAVHKYSPEAMLRATEAVLLEAWYGRRS
ncbi:MAG: glycosyltransferase [Proteobacteria bacterium]|nr:glycosyltransferase [Pseudomonadota bacterium]